MGLAVVDARKHALGDDNPYTLDSMRRLAKLYTKQGRYGEAERIFSTTLQSQRRVLGDDDTETLSTVNDLGSLYVKQNRYAEAEQLYVAAVAGSKRRLGEDHAKTHAFMLNLAETYSKQGGYAQAEPLYLAVLEASKRALGDKHPDTARALYLLGRFEARRGDRDKALDWLRRSVEAGWGKADTMTKESEFRTLQGPEFDALVEGARRNAARAGSGPGADPSRQGTLPKPK